MKTNEEIIKMLQYEMPPAKLAIETGLSIEMAELVSSAYTKGVGKYVFKYMEHEQRANNLEKQLNETAITSLAVMKKLLEGK